MALSWFKYLGPLNDSDPVVNPLNFNLYPSTPTFVANGSDLGYIYATVQMVNGIQRPNIPGVSATNSVTITQIHAAITNSTSSPNVILKP